MNTIGVVRRQRVNIKDLIRRGIWGQFKICSRAKENDGKF